MNFANKGIAMEDPKCARRSACVQGCPTVVLTFGHLDFNEDPVLDTLRASNVQMTERRQD
jgi:Fe-S-cluster-containing dehydrogenase component